MSTSHMVAKGREANLSTENAALKKLIEAGNALAFAAQTSGGTAGRDEGLVAAIENWVKARDAEKAVRRIERFEPEDGQAYRIEALEAENERLRARITVALVVNDEWVGSSRITAALTDATNP